MKPNDINPYSLALAIDETISNAFVNRETQAELDKVKSLFSLVDDLGYHIHIIDELQKVEYIQFNKYTRNIPDPLEETPPITHNMLKMKIQSMLEQVSALKTQAIREQNFERAASFRDKEKLLLDIRPKTPIEEVLAILNSMNNTVYPTMLKTHVRIVDNEIEIFILTRCKTFIEKIEGLVPIRKKGWKEWLIEFFTKRRK